MRDFLKGNLAVVLLVAAVAFGMWQWHRAELSEARNIQAEVNVKLAQTQNILAQLKFDNQAVANAFRQVGYQIQQPKTAKQDTAKGISASKK